MTDNAWAYRKSRRFAEALTQIGAVHKLIRPYRPQTNGKVERFHQTSCEAGPTNAHTPTTRNAAKPSPNSSTTTITTAHSSLNGQPPITKLVNHLCEKDT